MRLEQLECFVEVAQSGSISKVAQQMFLTQQAVSLNIKQLEKELNCDLLVRSKKGVALTKEGEATLEFAKQVLVQKDELLKTIDELQNRAEEKKETNLNIYSTSNVTNVVLPKIIAGFTEANQYLNIKMRIADNLQHVMDEVKTGNADIGLISFNEKELFRIIEEFQQELELDILARDRLIVVVDKKHYTGDEDYIKADEYYDSKQLRTIYNVVPIDEMHQGMFNTNMVASNDAEFHRNMLEKAGAMVMMSGLAYDYFFKSKKYVALPVEDIDVPLLHAAIYRKDAEPMVQIFAKAIRKEMHVK
ncbi:MAG: LysR family transcriptional regulator [Peptococcaceae bacterium]|nr:LysR family transcriptional regulator [Peptococcaceae bacterium]